MNYGTIKSVGNGQVDVQLTGSTAVLRNIKVSAQVNWNLLAVGTRVLVDYVAGQPVVLHTLADVPHSYQTAEQYVNAHGVLGGLEGALLADGSVPLTGDLAVAPGVRIDGYDLSVLGQTIDNLQAADSVARTGYTVLTHASHLVETIGPDDTQLKLRHDLFVDKEGLVVSNTAGEVEFMRVVGEAVPTVDDHGALCYLYTVTRRTATSPTNLVTGWAAATLVNGLTHRGYIAFDARANRPAAPSMRFVLHTDIDAGATEQIVRIGSLNNVLGYTDEDYGFAAGRLTTADTYLAYSYADNLLRLRGADLAGYDEAGTEVYRIWGNAVDGHLPGDFRFGPMNGGQLGWSSENERLSFGSGNQEIMYLDRSGARFREMVWSGTQPGPQIGIGEEGGQGHIVARNAAGVEQFHVRTGEDSVHIHLGNPPVEGGYAQFTQGEFLVDGTVRARAFELLGGGTITPGGQLLAQDPDSAAYGELAPRYLAGFNETGVQTALIAWGTVTVAGKTWQPGEGFLGPVTGSHFRKRGEEMGFFYGDTPKAWLDEVGDAYFAGSIMASGGSIAGWTIASDHLYAGSGSTRTGLQPASYPFYAGSDTPSAAPFRVTPAGALVATNATISGAVYAQSGYFSGDVYVGTADPRIKLDGVNKLIESTNFAAGLAGFRLSGETGDAEFNNVRVRGAMAATALQYGQVLATNGSVWVVKAAGQTQSQIAVPVVGTSCNIYLKDPEGMTHAAAGALWATGDILRTKEPLIGDVWYTVLVKIDMGTYWRLMAKVESGPGVCTFPTGATVLNYGQSGDGVVRITADDTNCPYISIATHTGTPWTALTERARLGNLAGIAGASGYGLWTDNGYFTGTINASAGSIAGWTISSTKLYWEDQDNYQGIGLATYDDPAGWAFWAGDHRPDYAEFRVSKNGALWAASATITGAITASSGSFTGALTMGSSGSITSGTVYRLNAGGFTLGTGVSDAFQFRDDLTGSLRLQLYASSTLAAWDSIVDSYFGGKNIQLTADAAGSAGGALTLKVYGFTGVQVKNNQLGFFGVTPASRPAAYTFTNGTADRAIDCDSTTIGELADVVYTMWNDLKTLGLLQ